MHELSIAQAVVEMVKRHTPAGATVQKVQIRAGPLQQIDEQALQWAWQSATAGDHLQGATMELESLPWRITCTNCVHAWTGPDPLAPCPKCGSQQTTPQGDDMLQLVSLEVV